MFFKVDKPLEKKIICIVEILTIQVFIITAFKIGIGLNNHLDWERWFVEYRLKTDRFLSQIWYFIQVY